MKLRLLVPTLGLVAGQLQGLPPENDRWIQAESAHFTFVSNAPLETVRTLSSQLELLRSVLASMNEAHFVNWPLPTYVFIFRDESSFRPYSIKVGGKPAAISGYFLAHPHANFVVIDGGSGSESIRIIYHEYLHSFVRHNLPQVPLWFNEGLAEFYSTFEKVGNEVLIGRPLGKHVDWLRTNDLIRFGKFAAIDSQSPVYNEKERKGAFYAQSWALVHMLLAGDPERRRQTTRYLDLLKGSDETLDPLQTAFEMGQRELQQELRDYVRRSDFSFFRQSLAGVEMETGLEVRTLDRSEVLYRLGYLVAHFNPARLVDADEHFAAALELDPDFGLAWAGQGYVQYLKDDYQAADFFYERAMELEKGDFLIPFLAAINVMKWLGFEAQIRSLAADEKEALVDTARRSFRRSIELKDDFGEAYAGLGSTFVDAQDPSDEGLQALRRARAYLPSRPDVTHNLAILSARLGHRLEANDLVELVLTTQADAATVELAREGLLRVDLMAADDYLRQGDAQAGLEIIEAVLAQTSDTVLFAELSEKADEIRAFQAFQADRQLFDEAMDLVRESRYDEAIERLETLVRRVRDSELQAVAEQNLRQLRGLP